jgi:hypothetical protein
MRALRAPRLPQAVGAVGPRRLDHRILLAAPSSTTFVSFEIGAAAYSDMAFQILTSSVSSRSVPPSACHGTRHLVQWTRTEMSGGRERGRRPNREAYLNMMMPSMKVAQKAALEQMAKEMRWASWVEMR